MVYYLLSVFFLAIKYYSLLFSTKLWNWPPFNIHIFFLWSSRYYELSVYTRGNHSGFAMNPKRFSTGLLLPFTHKRTNPKWKHPGLVMSPKVLNPESSVGTLNPPAMFWGCGRTKLAADPAIHQSRSRIDGHSWRSLVASSFCHRSRQSFNF